MKQLQKEQFLNILDKYNSGTASKEDLEFLDAYYEAFRLRADYTEDLAEYKRVELQKSIKSSIGAHISAYKVHKLHRPKAKIKWASVAAAAIVFLAGVWLFSNKNTTSQQSVHKNANQIIRPGGNKAVLTLSNGEKISLTDAHNGTLAKQGGVQIIKTAEGQLTYTRIQDNTDSNSQFNTIETPRGGWYEVRLPDGSKVWLNAASKLTYPSSFHASRYRKVELAGEAYFEIAEDKVKPFIVKAAGQEVQVLGTHFNINSYADEPEVKTTLVEGSVKVKNSNGLSKILKPGEQSALSGNEIEIRTVDPELAIAWKNNLFIFDSNDIRHVMRMIARWYDVDVKFKGPIPDDRFGGSVSRFDNVSEVLKALEATGRVKFNVEDRSIVVSK